MNVAGSYRRAAVEHVTGQFRYGIVLLLVLALVLFQIAAPAATWSFVLDVLLAGVALTVAVATSRAPGAVRRRRAVVISGGALIVCLGVAVGVIGATTTFVVTTLLIASIPATLIGGLVRLVRQEGVNAQVVAGALAMYLLVGLLFASIIAVASHVMSDPYFKQGKQAVGVDVYYSFTALTTTGFGDYTTATPFGHALAVLEMLTGQLYLVTVIGIVVGNFAGRRGRSQTQ